MGGLICAPSGRRDPWSCVRSRLPDADAPPPLRHSRSILGPPIRIPALLTLLTALGAGLLIGAERNRRKRLQAAASGRLLPDQAVQPTLAGLTAKSLI